MIAIGQHIAKHMPDVEEIVNRVRAIGADWEKPSGGIVALSAEDVDEVVDEIIAQGLLPPDFLKDRPLLRAIIELILNALLGGLIPQSTP